jgi:hypothetical protein
MAASTGWFRSSPDQDKKCHLNCGDDTYPRVGCRPLVAAIEVGDLPALLGGQVADPASSAMPSMTMTPAGPIPDPRMYVVRTSETSRLAAIRSRRRYSSGVGGTAATSAVCARTVGRRFSSAAGRSDYRSSGRQVRLSALGFLSIGRRERPGVGVEVSSRMEVPTPPIWKTSTCLTLPSTALT